MGGRRNLLGILLGLRYRPLNRVMVPVVTIEIRMGTFFKAKSFYVNPT